MTGSGGPGCPVGGRLGEEGAAGPVEVAGEDVEHVDEPARQRAVRDGAAADAAVYGGRRGGGEFAGEGACRPGVHVAGGGYGLGGEVPYGFAEFVESLEMRGQLPGVHEVFLEEHVGHRREEQRVGAGPDGDVAVGEFGGAGAAGVDDGEGAAAHPERLELAGEVGGGAQTPVGFQGLAPMSSRWSVWSRSGTGMALASPYSSPLETCLGIWSTVDAVKMLRVPSPASSTVG